MDLSDFAATAGLFVLATGGLFRANDNGLGGLWSDKIPAITAAAIFLIAILSRRLARPRAVKSAAADYGTLCHDSAIRSFWGLAVLAVLSLRHPGDLNETVSLLAAATALLAGRNYGAQDCGRRTILMTSLILIFIAFYQKFILFPHLMPLLGGAAHGIVESGRVFSEFMTPGQFSAYLGTIFPLAIAASMVDRWRKAARVIAVLILSGLYMAGSFSGVLTAAIGTIFLLGLSRRSAVVVFLLVLIFAGLVHVRQREVLVSVPSPILLRTATWSSTLSGAMDAPLLGHGPGSFERLYMTRYRSQDADEVRHPHSWPIKIIFEFGLVGLAAWLLTASTLFSDIHDRSFRAAAIAFFLATLLDIGDLSMTLRSLGFFCLGASLGRHKPGTR